MRRRALHATLGAALVLLPSRAMADELPPAELDPVPDADAPPPPSEPDAAPPLPDVSPTPAIPLVAPAEVAPVGTPAPEVDELPETGDGELAAPSKLQIYGFADMTVRRLWFASDDSIYRLYGTPEAGFAMGRINVYVRAEPAPRITSLLEVRLLYLPNGANEVAASGALEVTSTEVPDDADLGGKVSWGGIAIQRAQLDYQLTDRLTLRVGHWLTPYGIWNVDHGSPTVIGVRRPYIINQNLFPESQIGLQMMGTHAIGKAELAWSATISNGTAGLTSQLDHDLDKAIGGRGELILPALDELRIGVSAYVGREHTIEMQATTTDPSDPAAVKFERTEVAASTSTAIGVDVRLRSGRFRLLGEALFGRDTFGASRPMAIAPRTTGFEPDHATFGYYLVAGLQTAMLGAMPYVQYEESISNTRNTHARLGLVGLNFRPVPTVTFKVEMGGGRVSDWGTTLLPTSNMMTLQAQMAWMFR